MKQISFLIGSGFSIPSGLPSTTEITKIISKTKTHDFYFGTDESAGYLKDASYPNNQFEHLKERKFVEKFIEYYNTKVIKTVDKFNYEIFYDYFIDIYKKNNVDKDLEKFLSTFEKGNLKLYDKLWRSYLESFGKIFPQLIRSLLWKNFERSHLCAGNGGKYPENYEYGRFLNLIIHLSKKYRIHIHTLNHDLLLERFNSTDAFQGNLSDGFTTSGSEIYGEFDVPNVDLSLDKYFVRLPKFVDKFDTQFCLYKLHGSIDRYRLYFDNRELVIKQLNGILPFGIHIEKETTCGFKYYGYNKISLEKSADFLTGTEYKIIKYPDKFYNSMFDYFRSNLEQSESLIIIGYGFGDRIVNEYITDFLKDKSKNLVVVDIEPPKVQFLKNINYHFFHGGVSNFDFDKLVSVI